MGVEDTTFYPLRGRGRGRFTFAPQEHRPRTGPAWQLNTGAETANPTRAAGVQYQPTDFSQALKPRLGGPGGPLAPQFDFRSDAQKAKDNPAGGIVGNALINAAAPGSAPPPPLTVPQDSTPPPMLADVTDAAAPEAGMDGPQELGDVGQHQTTGNPLAGTGYETGNPTDILQQYGSGARASYTYSTGGGQTDTMNLPY